jgi:hypothetical protein
MEYKIKHLVEEGYDFKKLYLEKQEELRTQTGLDFDLETIVLFLQKQTNNFTIDNPIAHDLDNAIYGIVEKHGKEYGEAHIEEAPKEPETPKEEIRIPEIEKSEEEQRAELIEAIELLEMLGDDADEEAKEALEILKSLI